MKTVSEFVINLSTDLCSWNSIVKSTNNCIYCLVSGEKPAAMQHGSRSSAPSLVHTALPLCTSACVLLLWSTLVTGLADTPSVPTVRWWGT